MNSFEHCIRERDFTLTAELPLAPATSAAALAADLGVLREVVQAVQVTDSHDGIPHMAPLVAARICLDHGIDPVLQLSGRDRNRIALQSELLGAAATGVTSLLLLRGDRLPADLSPRAQKVYEFGAKRLLRAASLIGSEDTLPPRQGFFLGAPIKVIRPRDDWQPQAINTKADVGCKFVQTQPLLDVDILRAYMRRLVASKVLQRVSVIVSVPLPESLEALDALRQRARPAVVPDALRARLKNAVSAVDEGVALCAEVIAAVREVPGVVGVNLVGFRDATRVAEVVHHLKLKDDQGIAQA